MSEKAGGQPSASDARIASLQKDFSKLSGKLMSMESKLHTLEKAGISDNISNYSGHTDHRSTYSGYDQRSTVSGTATSIMSQPDLEFCLRLRALEGKAERTQEMLQSFAATNDRLAQLALLHESRALKEARRGSDPAAAPPTSPIQAAGNDSLDALDGLRALSERLTKLEERMQTAGPPPPAADAETENSTTAQLALLSESVKLLEQRFSMQISKRHSEQDTTQRLRALEQSQEKMQRELQELKEQMQLLKVGKEMRDCAEDEQHVQPACDQDLEEQDCPRPLAQGEVRRLQLEPNTCSANTDNLVTENMEGGTNQSSVKGNAEDVVQHDWVWRDLGGDGVEKWSFGNTIWDVAGFLGDHQVLTPMESLSIMFLLLASIGMQAGLTSIVWSSLGYSYLDDDTLQGYRSWRTDIGHSAQYMDPHTMESLASRVCRVDSSLHLSQSFSEQVAHMRSFLDENKPFNGPLMCVLAITIWILTVFRVFRELFDVVLAFANLPMGKTVVCIAIDKRLEVHSLSCARFFYILLLILTKACLTGWLLVAGLRFLFTTLSIEDVLLNAVALEFILNVETLFYDVLAPSKTHIFISLLKRIRSPRVKFCGLDVFDILRLVASIISVALAYEIGLTPELSKMKDAQWELCAGMLPFSYSVSAGGFVQWADTMLYTSAEHNMKMSSRYELLRGLIEESNSETINVFRLQPNALQKSVSETIIDVGERYNAKCSDKIASSFYKYADSTAQTMARFALRDAIGNQSISTCYEVERYCDVYQEQSGVSARLFCPQTCGCHSPQTALIYSSPSQGCPSSCSLQASYLQALETAPCMDLPKNMLVTYATSLQVAVSFKPDALQERVMALSELMLLHGCEAEGIEYLCSLGDMKSLSFFCPMKCRCNETVHELCPSSCGPF